MFFSAPPIGVKVLCAGEVHNGLQYSGGRTVCENYDAQDPMSGLHFTDADHVFDWLSHGDHVRDVLSAEDIVLLGPGRWKASAVTLGPPRTLLSLIARFRSEADVVAFHPDAIRCLRYPTTAAQLAAVRADWKTIRHLKAPPEAVQYEAIQQSWYAIAWINNPTPVMVEMARALQP